MKSAYELALEKLEAEDPIKTPALSEKQKRELEKTEKEYKAKIAERELFLKNTLRETIAKEGNGPEAEQIRQQIIDERARLEAEKEAKKEAIRQSL